jgi:hypothetical protein
MQHHRLKKHQQHQQRGSSSKNSKVDLNLQLLHCPSVTIIDCFWCGWATTILADLQGGGLVLQYR